MSHVLIHGSLIPLLQYRKIQNSLKSTDKGHHQRQQERVGEVRGPGRDNEIQRTGIGEIKSERAAHHSQLCREQQHRTGPSIS